MVFIELEPEPEPESSSSSKSTSKVRADDDSAAGRDADDSAAGRDSASDGFETASEGKDASDSDSNEEEKNHQEEQEGNDELRVSRAAANEDELKDDDKLNQKALTEANDAKLEGNKLFGEGLYEEALAKYELALQVAPDMPLAKDLRSTSYANRALCFSKLGKYEDTIKECTKALELNPEYLKALIRRGEAHEKLQHFDEAIADMEAILKLDPGNLACRRTIVRLKPLAGENKEKMKEEMIGKLKEMGNSVLGRFGMSVDNFKAVKEPNTGRIQSRSNADVGGCKQLHLSVLIFFTYSWKHCKYKYESHICFECIWLCQKSPIYNHKADIDLLGSKKVGSSYHAKRAS